MATKKQTTKRKTASSRIQDRLDRELTDIIKTLDELRTKISRAERMKWDFAKWRSEALHKVTESSSDVVKSATEVLERTMKISQAVTMGALEGARKALEEKKLEEEKKEAQPKQPKRRRRTTTRARTRTKRTTGTRSKKT